MEQELAQPELELLITEEPQVLVVQDLLVALDLEAVNNFIRK